MAPITNPKNPLKSADGYYRKGFQQGCNYGLAVLDQLIKNGYTYEEAKAICFEFVGSEVGKFRSDVNSYGFFPPHPQLTCKSDGEMTLLTYDENGNPISHLYSPTKTIGLGGTFRDRRSISSIIGGIIWEFFQREDEVPNRLTIFMGDIIRKSRIENSLSLEELAEKAYLSKGVLQAIEEGKIEITTSNLIYLATALNKPLISFFPPSIAQFLDPQYLSVDEMEFLMLLHQIDDERKQHIFNHIRLFLQEG